MPDLEILCRAIWILASSTTLSPQRTDLQTTHSQDPSRCLARRSLQNSILGYRRLMNSLSCDNNERSYRQPHPPPPLNTRIARLTATTAAPTSTPPWLPILPTCPPTRPARTQTKLSCSPRRPQTPGAKGTDTAASAAPSPPKKRPASPGRPTSCSIAAFGIGPGPPAQCPTSGASK